MVLIRPGYLYWANPYSMSPIGEDLNFFNFKTQKVFSGWKNRTAENLKLYGCDASNILQI
jgi:hypothetical protein